MRVLTVLGTRPQIVKAAPVSRALAAAGHEEIVLHTGQHYDGALTGVLGEASGVPAPARFLGVGSGGHAAQAGKGARGVAAFAEAARPDAILAVGDTNSALAAALGARAAGVPLVHGEAGVRLGSLVLPEEANRVAADHLADLCLCPTERAAAALRAERPRARVAVAGDPLLDALAAAAPEKGPAGGAGPAGEYLLVTLHRAENTDDPARLRRVVDALASLPLPVVWPVHPRTRAALDRAERWPPPAPIRAEDPVRHRATLDLAHAARAVVTDSGGLQREAYWMGVPCVVLREDCEWRETVEEGWAVLAGADPARLRAAAESPPRGPRPPDRAAFGGGEAAARWVAEIERAFG
jgi:UDP-N-acetylglucosamine 2-epimerase